MRLLALVIILTCNIASAQQDPTIKTVPAIPSADQSFLAQYIWRPAGCGGPFTVYDDGKDYQIVKVENTIKLYANVSNYSCLILME